MGQLIPFSFDNKTIRVIADERGEPLFVGKDICDVLGYKDPTTAMRSHCRGVQILHPIPDSLGRMQEMRVLTEGDMFRLVVNSTLPAAEAFERMVFDEILPTIRRTGGYSQPQQTTELARVVEAAGAFDPLMKVALAIGCDQNTAAISANQAIIKLTHVNLLETIDKTHLVAPNQEAVYLTPTEIGKQVGISNQKVNAKLAQLGLQVKVGEHWQPTPSGQEFSRILDTGKRHNSGTPVPQMKWSSAVVDLLKTPRAA